MPVINKQTLAKKPQAQSTGDGWPEEDDGIKLSLYGKSGTGKTTFWATFPGPILAIICSGGNKPGELRSIDTPEYRKKITPKIVRSSPDAIRAIKEAKASGKYKTLVVDHGSGVQDLCLKEILGLEELPAQLGWGVATQQQYGQCALQTKEILRSALSYPGNTVIVAHERNFNDDGGNDMLLPTIGSALMPSTTNWLNGACDYICNTFIRQKEEEKEVIIAGKKKTVKSKTKAVEYCLRTAPNAVYTTKFRKPKGRELPELIVDPDFDKFYAIVKG